MKFSAALSFAITTAACSVVSTQANERTASDSRRTSTRVEIQPDVPLEPEVQPEDVAAVPVFMHSAAPLQAQSRIVGGTQVPDVATYPWFVQGRGCSGSLIAKDMVLTAAHCEGFPFDLDVLLNSLTAYDDIRAGKASKPAGAEEVSVARDNNGASIQVPHPDYNTNTEQNDYMLVKLQTAVPNAQLVELNFDETFPPPNQELRVIGVGTTSQGGSASDFLLQVDVDYVSNNKCNNFYGEFRRIYDDVMICAAVTNGGKDSCQGDSGGPLFDETTRKQVGVVSWGIGCGDRNYPGVYSRLSGAEEWIKSVVCGNSAASSDFPPDFCATPAPPTPAPAPPAPTPAPPTNSPPTTGSYQVEVIVKHDSYPEETGWTLKDSSGEVLLSQGTGTYKTPGGQVSRTVSVPDGTYVFEIFDNQGDGICCEYGSGAYEIKIDGESSVISGTRFTTSIAENFLVGYPESVDYVVAIQYDAYPEETEWQVEDANGNFIIGVAANKVSEDFAYYEFTIDAGLVAGEDYVIRLRDEFGDGFCCGDSGDGFIGLYAVINNAFSKQLGGGAGEFEFNAVAPFSVPANLATKERRGGGTEKRMKFQNSLELPPTKASTIGSTKASTIGSTTASTTASTKVSKLKAPKLKVSTPSCLDLPDATFDVNDKIGSQTCAWLLLNVDQHEYLCQFEDVAAVCPNTCGRCGLDTP
jgi:V8-like Glu-specific endopeptidase